jgi:hypothetical protein
MIVKVEICKKCKFYFMYRVCKFPIEFCNVFEQENMWTSYNYYGPKLDEMKKVPNLCPYILEQIMELN